MECLAHKDRSIVLHRVVREFGDTGGRRFTKWWSSQFHLKIIVKEPQTRVLKNRDRMRNLFAYLIGA
jgi:hypothetical protein